jgi:hypothetical protein
MSSLYLEAKLDDAPVIERDAIEIALSFRQRLGLDDEEPVAQ